MPTREQLTRRVSALFFKECSSHGKCRTCENYDNVTHNCVLADVASDKTAGFFVNAESVRNMKPLRGSEKDQLKGIVRKDI